MGGGGKGGAKAPTAPNYTALAQQQGQINQQTAQDLTRANRPNQTDAFGNSITWSQSLSPDQQSKQAEYQRLVDYANGELQKYPGSSYNTNLLNDNQAKLDALKNNGTWNQQQTMSPENKAAWDTYLGNARQASSSFGNILNKYLSGYNSPSLTQYDPNSTDKSVSDALYGSVMDRGRVEQQRETDALTTQLRNSGLQPGSEAFNRAMQNLTTSHNDANLLAAQNATLAGGQEARAQYQTQLGGELAGRNQPLQELSGMAGMAGGQPYSPSYPGFGSATGYNPTDLLGAAQAQYGASANKANASNSKKGGMLGAATSLGGSYLGSK